MSRSGAHREGAVAHATENRETKAASQNRQAVRSPLASTFGVKPNGVVIRKFSAIGCPNGDWGAV